MWKRQLLGPKGLTHNHFRAVAPVVATLRPKGMGLGADRSQLKQLNHTSTDGAEGDKEELVLKKGSYCVILKGSNKDLYGVVSFTL